MKKLLFTATAFLLSSLLFAETYKVTVEGKAYVQISETERVPLEAEDEVSDEDIIEVKKDSTVTIFAYGKKYTARREGEFKVADKVKLLKQ